MPSRDASVGQPFSSSLPCHGAELSGRAEGRDLMGMPSLVPRYTAEEIRGFPDDRLRYEVIRGELLVTPAPGTAHQRAVLELATLLKGYTEQHDLGETLIAPFEVELAEDSAVQPDILVILRDRAHQLTSKRLIGPPSLVIEVISLTTKRTDRLQKRTLYLEEGVEEYWVVDPDSRQLERWRRGAGKPEIFTDNVAWCPVPGIAPLVIELVELFGKVWRRD